MPKKKVSKSTSPLLQQGERVLILNPPGKGQAREGILKTVNSFTAYGTVEMVNQMKLPVKDVRKLNNLKQKENA